MDVKFPKIKNFHNQPFYFIQPKFDGHLTKIFKGEKGQVQVLTKNNKDISEKIMNIPTVGIQIAALPNKTIVFGELHCPGIKATSVPTLLNNSDERLELPVFAVPLFHGIDCRNDDLIDVMKLISNYGVVGTKTWRVLGVELDVDPIRVSYIATDKMECHTDMPSLLNVAVKLKLEGWVLKQNHMSGWFKFKPTKTADVFVLSTCKSFEPTY
jgi:hypothetical protein